MFTILSYPRGLRAFVTLFALVSFITVTTHVSLAADRDYEVELVVSEGKKSVETDAVLTIKDKTFTVIPDKSSFASSSKVMQYDDIKTADYSYAKKPMLSGGGAIATALLVGFIFAIPFLFIKKKKHWITIQTEKDFAVIKLGDNNHRQIVAELETHGVKVSTVQEDEKNKK